MLIWFNLLIPIIALLILRIFFSKYILWWEYLIVFLIPLVTIGISKYISTSNQITDTEILNYHFTSATYTEEYETYVEETCTRQVACGTDKDGNTIYCTESYDCSYCDHNPEHYDAIDNCNNSYSISKAKYHELKNLWLNETFVDLKRNINKHWNCGKDGNAYKTRIKNDSLIYMSPIVKKHIYENRIQCSNNVYNFEKIDTFDIKQYGLYNYPLLNEYNYNPILGYNSITASKKLQQWNSYLGAIKRCHLLICIYKNKTNTAATKQQSFWKGGNKNEIVLCIGIDNQNIISWSYVFSWTENELLKVEIRNNVKIGDTLKIVDVVDTLGNQVLRSKGYVKRSFKQFKYINVEPTTSTIIISFFVTILLTVLLSIYSIKYN